MNYNTKITPTQGRKVEITITTQQLWKNFIDSWRDIVTDRLANIQRIQSLIAAGVRDFCMLDTVAQVTKSLCTDNPNITNIRKLFIDGLTCMLLGDAMNHIDPPPQVFDGVQDCKIHVVNPTDNTTIGTIYHSQLVY